ncbi:hypothetical protein [Brucella intermedia]|uniref:hypothetical protein n=1 Tax=Brucella intermedia TaxID=94625 RepID=UPI0004687712|nr:hypothetical protein [Brucella intermedia]
MAVFTQGGRVVLAQALYDVTMFLAVGKGDPAWDGEPQPTTPAEQEARDTALSVTTDLVAKVGVTRTRDKFFVKPDNAGTILMGDGSIYSQSDVPTASLYVRFQLDLPDAAGSTLRETGIFVGTQLGGAVPDGQQYIPAADVVNFGTMIDVDRFAPIVRDGSIGQTFSFILTM